jgi:hypothetical protein
MKSFNWILGLIIIGIIVITALCLLPEITSADVSSNQILYYSQINQSQNDPIEYRVAQGDTIYQGKTYDLSGVSGDTLVYAHWNDWKSEDVNCQPDQIIDIRYWTTLNNKRAVWTDPAKWITGNWYYWDDYECGLTYYDYSLHQIVTRTTPFQAENKLAFRIVKPSGQAIPQNRIIPTIMIVPGYIRLYSQADEIQPIETPAQAIHPAPDNVWWVKYLLGIILVGAIIVYILIIQE